MIIINLLYIILKGEVGVFGPRPLDDINRDLEQLKKPEEIELIVKILLLQDLSKIKIILKIYTINFILFQQYKKDYKLQTLITYLKCKMKGIIKMEYHQKYQKIFQYYSGQSFGDVALTSDKPRSASIAQDQQFI